MNMTLHWLNMAGSALTLLAMTLSPAIAQTELVPDRSDFATGKGGLAIHYEIYGSGQPIVVLAGGLMPIKTMHQLIGPLARHYQVIAIDLEGHGKTGLRDSPMSHARNGDDVATVLAHLGIEKADIAGYSHGGDAALWTAIGHPEMVRNLIIISTAFAKDGWYKVTHDGMEGVSAALAEQLKSTPIYESYGHPEQFPLFLDRMGELMRQNWDWREQVRTIKAPALLIFADHDSVTMPHIAEFYALFGGGLKEPGVMNPQFSRARLAIIPGYTHYNLGQAPQLAEIIHHYLVEPTSQATMFSPG